jgi:pimeloyl-ACP methyl ester carboxylesterase
MKHPIVILHGWGLSAKVFEPLARALRTHGYQVYIPDFPGFGNTGIPAKPLFLKDYVEFLSGYMEKKNIRRPIIIGHSFGGRVALKYQFLHPTNVTALILTGTPGFTPVAKKVFIVIAKIGKLFFNIPVIRNWYYYAVGARDYYRARGVMKDTFKNIVREDLVPYMRSVRVPTLLVWGEHDIITPIWITEKMRDTIKKAKLIIIPNSDHGVLYKNPKEFVATIYDFLFTLT